MKFRKKPVVIDAITFDQLVQHGRDNGGNIVSGMPWSFSYNGHAISHENDRCYLIPTKEGTMNFTPEDMLITGVQGEIYPCKRDIFAATYEAVVETKTYADGTNVTGTAPLPEASPFAGDVAAAINRHSKENGSDTPDFILASFLADCLAAFDEAAQRRRKWYAAPAQTSGLPG